MDKNWHASTIEEVAQLLNTDSEHGLNSDQIQALKDQYGENKLAEAKQKTRLQLFLQQFNQPLVIILLNL